MYKTIMFSDGSYSATTYKKYEEWLDEVQKQKKIEIIAVTGLEHVLIVTYRDAQ
ncbi:hypothetical protein [Salirhabdus sp. Marseille-P4669]|uniref:hypothetical protein n=1 Tax=Salirhabdus sp. Marseille-P4669 TaxID=2042310 RepID=UPI00135CA499|nr:hypothetical protein [Salirhabdus sp. Marseille-P4669]